MAQTQVAPQMVGGKKVNRAILIGTRIKEVNLSGDVALPREGRFILDDRCVYILYARGEGEWQAPKVDRWQGRWHLNGKGQKDGDEDTDGGGIPPVYTAEHLYRIYRQDVLRQRYSRRLTAAERISLGIFLGLVMVLGFLIIIIFSIVTKGA